MSSRIAYVTSGMGGVGTAICQALARSGHTVVAGCAPDSPRRAAWLAAQKALGFHFIASEGDVTDWASTTRAFGAVQRELGPIDVLVHNAGRSCERHFRDMAPSDWQAVIRGNIDSLFNVTKQVVDSMMERRFGRIVLMASLTGGQGRVREVNYATAKAAAQGFTRSLAQELAPHGITVNTVSPGHIAGAGARTPPPDVLQQLAAATPVRRLGRPEEVASLCNWLASDDAAFMTGVDFPVNGGALTGR
ncbi:MAG: SDR family oxidoreductase [Aquincola sp.]|uniref:SDR family oxidoreductase n=1 Tax=Aquincola tertiaricarbonis TaxID=391953 RepID=A0ABY4SCV1_AQUTE|nr:SDR family oxidoreductase [Aquincola tertiaricarbonis]MBQ1761828.1 SDR family oxidoreductase [Aquincola sp.]URI10420.1 SDR family oxidoreductase [Aquincola tertiaricarbonis]